MNADSGKRKYASYAEAHREAQRLARDHKQGYQAYKVDSVWAVGGIHMKKMKKVKSFDDLHQLLDRYKQGDGDTSIDAYISDIASEGLVSESEEVGAQEKWILLSAELKLGRDIGMSPSNSTTYLLLNLKKVNESITIKMGGKFGIHIPVVKRQCDKLLNKPVRWHTWNSSVKTTNWLSSEWFYLLEEDTENE